MEKSADKSNVYVFFSCEGRGGYPWHSVVWRGTRLQCPCDGPPRTKPWGPLQLLLQEIHNEEAGENEHMAGGFFKVPSSLNPHCEPFDPSALSSEHSIGDISKGSINIKENKEDENNNTKACEELESAADTSSTLGDKAKETAVSNAKGAVVEDEKCKSIRPKIILKANCRRKS